jgi:methylmalonyl-CoA mutase N-terminal domain/subunit
MMETLTNQLVSEASKIIEEVEAMGGMTKVTTKGILFEILNVIVIFLYVGHRVRYG